MVPTKFDPSAKFTLKESFSIVPWTSPTPKSDISIVKDIPDTEIFASPGSPKSQRSTRLVATSIGLVQTIPLDHLIVFDSWSGDLATPSKNNPEITLPVTHYGTLVANFKEVIPSEYLTTNLIIPVMLGTILPAIFGWFIARKRRSNLSRYLKMILAAYEVSDKNKEESLQRLSKIRRNITGLYYKGKLSDEDYGMLDDKISEYYDKVTPV